ncbi:MAG: RNA polymerase sigma factor [Pseudomonadota bacterium]
MAIIPFRKPSREKQFEEAVQPHLTALYRFAYRLTGRQEDAEDLVQEVLTRLYPKADEVLAVDHRGPWLKQVLYRQFIDQTRKRSWHAERVASDVVSDEYAQDFFDSLLRSHDDPESAMNGKRLKEAVASALNRLMPDERTLVLLHDVDGWRQEDIARVLDTAVGTIKSRLHRCRRKLRAELGEELEPFLDDLRLKE